MTPTITSVQNRSRSTWDKTLEAVQADDKRRIDYKTTFKDLTVLPNDATVDPNMTFVNAAGVDSMTMTERAYRQYLSRLGIQHRQAVLFSGVLQGNMIQERLDYRDPGDKEPLVQPDAEIFLRTRTGNPNRVRAILSGRYGNMRDAAVAEAVAGLLPKLDTYEVLRGRVADHIFSVTLLGKVPVFENGDKYYPIHVIQNSEVGASSFRVSSGVCKGACSNGMIFGHRTDCSVRIRHLGANMQTRVVKALNEALGNVGRWKDLVQPAIAHAKSVLIDLEDEKQLNRAVTELRNRGLTKRLAVKVIAFSKNLPEEVYGDEFATVSGASTNLVTRWHIINSMTHLAQDVSVFGELERHDIEEAAGKLLLTRAA
jgi:hypothetical protein